MLFVLFLCYFILGLIIVALLYLLAKRRRRGVPNGGVGPFQKWAEDRRARPSGEGQGNPADYREGAPTVDRDPSAPRWRDDQSPGQIGRYRILEQLGEGGMGKVYKAHDPQLDRVVALKLPRFDGGKEDRTRRGQRFQREARAAAQVWHPHVCPIYDVGEHDGQPYVVMAYVQGQSLAERLKEIGRFEDVGQAVDLVRQILDALETVHTHGIIHRDLKPGNILIDQARRAVLTDFGLARPENDAEHLTSEGVIVGTPAYMAPEQAAAQHEKVGPWTDLYSLGVVLYRMLAGRLPFEGPPLQVLSKIMQEAPPLISSFRADLDPALEGILLQALAKEPKERYQSARAFAAALEGLSLTPSIKTPMPTPLPGSHSTHQLRTEGRSLKAVPVRKRPHRPVWPGALFTVLGGTAWVFYINSWICWICGIVTVGSLSWLLVTLKERFSVTERSLINKAAKGDYRAVLFLISRGIPVNGKDEMGETALMKAAENGHEAVVKLLVVQGAEVNERNPFGKTALALASAKRYKNIVELLKQAGAKE
jgi:serine/threonine protein kinase